MGVVRREGEWRLEKQEEGLYEVTYQGEPQAQVVTPRYSSGLMDDVGMSMLPVHEVSSYAEAEGTFEECAHGDPPSGMAETNFGSSSGFKNSLGGGATSSSGGNHTHREMDGNLLEELEDVPPGGIALISLMVGGLLLYNTGFAPGQLVFLIGVIFAVVGIGIFAWAGALFRTNDLDTAAHFLVSVEEGASNSSGGGAEPDGVTKTPPTPEKLKNELIFSRANHTCEWCGQQPLDNPEVHHIEPRSEGGPNEPKNLIVLCPTCHRKADRGGITKTKLKGKMRHIRSEQS